MHRLLVIVLCAVLGVVACDDAGSPSVAPRASIAPLDLNTATIKQLEALPKIGATRARSIMASRNARGGRFRSLDQLREIDGIGEATIEAIRPLVIVR